jgi:hypothetical protein
MGSALNIAAAPLPTASPQPRSGAGACSSAHLADLHGNGDDLLSARWITALTARKAWSDAERPVRTHRRRELIFIAVAILFFTCYIHHRQLFLSESAVRFLGLGGRITC